MDTTRTKHPNLSPTNYLQRTCKRYVGEVYDRSRRHNERHAQHCRFSVVKSRCKYLDEISECRGDSNRDATASMSQRFKSLIKMDYSPYTYTITSNTSRTFLESYNVVAVGTVQLLGKPRLAFGGCFLHQVMESHDTQACIP